MCSHSNMSLYYLIWILFKSSEGEVSVVFQQSKVVIVSKDNTRDGFLLFQCESMVNAEQRIQVLKQRDVIHMRKSLLFFSNMLLNHILNTLHKHAFLGNEPDVFKAENYTIVKELKSYFQLTANSSNFNWIIQLNCTWSHCYQTPTAQLSFKIINK